MYIFLFHDSNNYHNVFRNIKLISFYKTCTTLHDTLVLLKASGTLPLKKTPINPFPLHKHAILTIYEVGLFSSFKMYMFLTELPRWLSIKEFACSAGTTVGTGSIPGLGRSTGGGHDNPLQYSCLENPADRGALFLQ